MISEKKVRLMTRAALIEEKNKKELFVSKKFYSSDYTLFHTIKAVVGITFVFLIVVGFMMIDASEVLTTEYKVSDLLGYGRLLLFIYLGVLAVTIIISIISCTEKYYKAKERTKEYKAILKKLSKGYDRQAENAKTD